MYYLYYLGQFFSYFPPKLLIGRLFACFGCILKEGQLPCPPLKPDFYLGFVHVTRAGLCFYACRGLNILAYGHCLLLNDEKSQSVFAALLEYYCEKRSRITSVNDNAVMS